MDKVKLFLLFLNVMFSAYFYQEFEYQIKRYINNFVYICSMKTIDIIKGIHPGKMVERELKKRNINKRQFALSIDEYPQTLGAIIKGSRRMNIELSLKIEEKLEFDEGFLMTLQVFYDIKEAKKDSSYKPDLSKLRKVTFWDTTFDRIDWKQNKIAVVKRVFSRGTEIEQEEIIRFYGKEVVDRIKLLKHEL
ncbi:Plasmid maintenance system antidote protein VapI, contains XRE-type HTH domain [Flavobacterium gillisiae]|uniref:Plasmid maintenance system antidote protein VapI, contains XRE-type HTH domain n=2 Tax=Flavobacterium gillisiae TaxID=150146 RepID=A0A1H4D9L1_9FLAO|nr:Plasmid maintenance system antidote protein VapI, contains XRE-type HTH domain [Flavobacterium gillisiae]